jgi:hypothetical protein
MCFRLCNSPMQSVLQKHVREEAQRDAWIWSNLLKFEGAGPSGDQSIPASEFPVARSGFKAPPHTSCCSARAQTKTGKEKDSGFLTCAGPGAAPPPRPGLTPPALPLSIFRSNPSRRGTLHGGPKWVPAQIVQMSTNKIAQNW